MIEHLPEPLTPADCDLRNFPYLPVDVTRMRDSDMAGLLRPEECWAAFLLCLVSWHQVPAASLPDNDRLLARLADCSIGRWRRIRERVLLRSWVRCSDGRFYHPVVAEKALNAWSKSRKQKERAEQRWGATKSMAQLDSDKDKSLISLDLRSAMALQEKERGRGKEKSSVPEGTGDTPSATPHLDSGNRLAWAKAVTVLTTQGAHSEPAARKAFGKLITAHQLDPVDMFDALGRCEASQTPDPIAYLTMAARGLVEARASATARRTDAPRTAHWGDRHWDLAITRFHEQNHWSEEMGPSPTEPGCRAPPEVLARHGCQGRAILNSTETE